MTLIELTQDLRNLIITFIKEYSDNKMSQNERGGSLKELCEESGNCAMISETLVNWLKMHIKRSTASEMGKAYLTKAFEECMKKYSEVVVKNSDDYTKFPDV